jgi:hypothetical protein
MARARLIGVCAVVALALTAVGVSSASAAEVGECLKVAKVEGFAHGKYTDKNCKVHATPAEEAEGRRNKWEWSPGLTPERAPFTAKGKTAALVGAAGTIECRNSLTVGEWTGPKTGTETITFEGCEIKSPEESECTSAGHAERTIVTSTLTVTLLGEGESSPEFNYETNEYEPKVVGPGEVWEQLRGPGNELTSIWTEYECDKVVVIQTEGSVAGVLPPAAFPNPGSVNVMSKKSEVRFDEGKGAQGWLSEANILGKGFVPIGKGVLQTTSQAKAAGKIEFHT